MGNTYSSSNFQSSFYRFFYKGSDDQSNEYWVPFDLEDNIKLETCYQNSLQNIESKIIILGDYEYDVEKFLQINRNDRNKLRIIRRVLPSNTMIIKRNDSHFSSSIKLHLIDENNLSHLSTVECEFKVIPNQEIKFKVAKNMNFFKNKIDIKFESFKDLLSVEINNLSIKLMRENVFSKTYLDKIIEHNFFDFIMKMYEEESFINKELDLILKEGHSNDYDLIKYYYTSLLASFEICSKEYSPKLNKILESNNRKLYRGCSITPDEFKLYSNSENLIMITDNFISTTYDIENAHRDLNYNLKYCMYEIDIPDDKDVNNNLALMTDISFFSNEKKVLIRPGTIFNINKCEINQKSNIYEIKISIVSNSLEELKLFLSTNQTLNTINLSGNQFADCKAKYIADVLEKNYSLKSIDLSWNRIGDIGSKYIADALEKNKTLNIINLSGNIIGKIGAKYLANAIERNQTLKSIDLSENKLGRKGGKAIAIALGKNQTLTSINLNKNQIEDNAARHLGSAIEKNNTLKKISLSENLIGKLGAKHIAYGLEKNHCLKKICLGENQIRKSGAKYIADALGKNTKLQKIYLGQNKIKDLGSKYISEALEKNKILKEIYLSGNKIGESGAKFIANTLEKNNTLRIINLSGNQLGDIGAKYFADALEKNQTIKSIDLSANLVIKVYKNERIKIYFD